MDARGISGRMVEALSLAAGMLIAGESPVCAGQVVDLATDSNVVRIQSTDRFDDAGQIVAGCDVNGDGTDDLVLSAWEASGPNNARPLCGEVYVLYGRSGAWPSSLTLANDTDVWIYGEDAFDSLIGIGCGDVNGDGFGDLALGADNANGPGNVRAQAGQVHLILGGPSLPPVIDLATSPGTVIYGAVSEGIYGHVVRVGDVNGDGYGDIVGSASNARNEAGTIDQVGRIHIVFGRPTWPATIDLLTQSDVTIFGGESGNLGRDLAIGDWNGDGIADIFAGFQGGDGPNGQRTNCGHVYVFHGRTTWPSVIDLANDPPDTLFYGPDPNDGAGRAHALGLGDFDDDGVPELLIGVHQGDGPSNAGPDTGEVRTYQGGTTPPATVDLRTDSKTIVWGADTGDNTGANTRGGDVNGDGIDDLVTYAYYGDGPSETRSNAGEIYVLHGHPGFPVEIDLGTGPEDLIVYGPAAGMNLALTGLADLNRDGVREILSVEALSDPITPPVIYILSPYDSDSDGFFNLRDNCPALFNPDQSDIDSDTVGDVCDNCPNDANPNQRDSDADGFGDVCDLCPGQPGSDLTDPDGDGVTNCFDNCPLVPNPAQSDTDGDGIGDPCDPCPADPGNDPDGDSVCAAGDNCGSRFNPAQRDADGDGVGDLCDLCPDDFDPGQGDADGDGAGDACDCQSVDPGDRSPPPVGTLRVARGAGGEAILSWELSISADAHSVTRGALSALSIGEYGSCLAEGIPGTSHVDPTVPPPGTGYAYLVQAQNFDCGVGPLGPDSTEAARINANPGACAGTPHSDLRAFDETTVFGTVTGSRLDTLSSNDVYESIQEVLSTGGNPSSRLSRLEHRWRFSVPPSSRLELHVEGFRTASADGDDFAFEWSTDGVAFAPVSIGSLPASDEDRDLEAPLPPSLAGTVTIRVVDTNRAPGTQSLDSVRIDEIFVRAVP